MRTKTVAPTAAAVLALIGLMVGPPAAPAGAQTPCADRLSADAPFEAGMAPSAMVVPCAAIPPAHAAVPLVQSPPASAANGELSIADVAALARPSVVDILLDDDSGGTGVRVSAGVVTNAHVVGEATKVRLTLHDGTRADATVIRKDAGYDLALLHTEANVPALELEPVGAQRQGDTVLVLGYPGLSDRALSSGATLTRGIISAVRTSEETGATLIQTDAPVNPGNSGGALLNLRGRLIGIPSFTLGYSPGLGFAVAADTVQAFLDGQPSRRPVAVNLAPFLVPAAELGRDYEGYADSIGSRDRQALAYADSPTGPSVMQLIVDAGSTDQAIKDLTAQAASAAQEGMTEVRMAITAGKRAFVHYADDAQDVAVMTSRGPYVVTVLLDFAGLPDTGGRTELAVKIMDMILARLPA